MVIADRNNHQRREREQLIADVSKIIPDAKFVALHYVHHRGEYEDIKQITRDRVLLRGDNHQTIQAASKSSHEIIGIMNGFLDRFQPVDTDQSPDEPFETVINLDITATSRENLERVVNQLHSEFPALVKHKPSSAELDQAIEAALKSYRPDVKVDIHRNRKELRPWRERGEKASKSAGQSVESPKERKVEYFCISVAVTQVLSALEETFSGRDAQTARFYRQLQATRRVQPKFHVTIIHRAAETSQPEKWKELKDIFEEKCRIGGRDADLGRCTVQLEKIVWDDRVLCIAVKATAEKDGGGHVREEVFDSVNSMPHITIGTANSQIC